MKRVGKVVLLSVLILVVAIPMSVFAGGGGERSTRDFPTRPVELLIPYGPGGTHDLVARAITAVIPKYLGQSMVVTLRPGASGVIGTTEIANAPPDGYRLLFAGWGPNSAFHAAQDVPYAPESFVPIAMVNYAPRIVVVPGNSPFQTLDDVIRAIRARPGQLNYGTSGSFSNGHIDLAALWDLAGVLGQVEPIHFEGGGAQLAAILGGQVDVGSIFHSVAIDHVRTGALRVLGVTNTHRIPADEADGLYANVPTLQELGYDVVFRMWRAVFAPAGTPEPVVRHLRNAFEQLSRDPEFIELNARLGERADQWMDGPEFQRMWDEERAGIVPIVRRMQQMER